MGPKCRALLITPLYPPQVGGVQRFLEQLSEDWPDDLRVLTVSYDRDRERRYDASRDWPIERVTYRRRMTPLRIARAAGRSTRGCDYLVWGTLRLAAFVGLIRPRLRRLPWVIAVYGKELSERPFWPVRRLERWALRRARRVVAISRYAAQQAVARGARPDAIRIIAPGIDPSWVEEQVNEARVEALRKRYSLGSGPILLSVGRLVLRKGVDQALRALPQIVAEHPDLVYVIVGSGPAGESLEGLAADLGIADRVRLVGRAPEEDLVSWYDLADLFLMPSRVTQAGDSEGFGIVFLEAQARAVPVIAGDEGGMADAVCPEAGRLVDGHDAQAIARAALEILGRPDGGRALGLAGQRYVRAEMTTAVQRTKWARLAREIVDG